MLARDADAPRLGGRELSEAWETGLEASGLPLYRPAGRARARIAFGAPLPVGIAAEAEPAEILLAERVPLWQVRAAVEGVLPAGWRLVDLFDVWVGGAPLAGRVTAAEYRVELASGNTSSAGIASAAQAMLAASELPRTRQKGEGTVAYDLRRLLDDVVVIGGPNDSTPMLRLRTRIHPELGTGRPEEVIAELGDRVGSPLEVRSIVRERLIVSDESR